MKSRRVTLRDVAALAGVNYSTVSRVLRGTNDAVTRTETCKRIMDAAKKLNYHPNRMAMALKTARANCIGVVITDLSNPSSRDMIYAIERVAGTDGVSTVIHHIDNKHRPPHSLLQVASDSHVDGLIISARHVIEGELGSLADLPCAVVVVNETENIKDFVALDHAEATRLATQHLIDYGHRTIMLLPGEEKMFNARRRIEGYRKALGLSDLSEHIFLTSGYSAKEAFDVVSRLFDTEERPTGIVASHLNSAVAVIAAVLSKGLRVPADVSVISLQNDPMADFLNPAISAVDFPFFELGEAAARALLAKINGMPTDLPRFLSPCRYVERASVGSVPVGLI